ncbi:ABC transporter permease [Pseudonocardia xinjiangensis]|uniref:ABC transporter permease n=1 Tax=Pseudonocardia xinjiangensis TaxID=75289 RepID=UPI003D91DD55
MRTAGRYPKRFPPSRDLSRTKRLTRASDAQIGLLLGARHQTPAGGNRSYSAPNSSLKRSTTWPIALIQPLLAVMTGTVNLANDTDQLDAGWPSFTSQVALFYGLLFSSMGIGLLAATVWRMEHRGTNWNLLLTTTRQPIRLVLAKIAAIAVPVFFMQAVLVVATLISGVFVLHLHGAVPWQFALVGALAVIAALPLVAVQSLLSMLLGSFAAPVEICLVGCVIGVATELRSAAPPQLRPSTGDQHPDAQPRLHRHRGVRWPHRARCAADPADRGRSCGDLHDRDRCRPPGHQAPLALPSGS